MGVQKTSTRSREEVVEPLGEVLLRSSGQNRGGSHSCEPAPSRRERSWTTGRPRPSKSCNLYDTVRRRRGRVVGGCLGREP